MVFFSDGTHRREEIGNCHTKYENCEKRLLLEAQEVLYGKDSSIPDAEKISRRPVYTDEQVAMEAAAFQAAKYQIDARVRDKFA
jgi:hypothetical protein